MILRVRGHSRARQDETAEAAVPIPAGGEEPGRRLTACVAVSAAALAMITVIAASAPQRPAWSAERICPSNVAARATFRAHAHGSPLTLQVGRWEVDGTRATLRFAGAQALPVASRFTATWVTPLSRSKKRHDLKVQSEIGSVTPADSRIRLTEDVRFRVLGGCWSAWQRLSESPSAIVEAYHAKLDAPVRLGSPGRVQYQWRLRGYLKAPSVLTGGTQASVS